MPLVSANGLDICYEERGQGEPVVLVAGIGMQLVNWPDGFLDRLVDKGFRVIVFDNRDVGRSSKLSHLGVPDARKALLRALLGLSVDAPYTLFDMASDVASLLDAIGLTQVHLVGVSLGGMVAQATAIAHGHRLRSLTSMMSHPGGRVATLSHPKATMKLLAPAPRSREQAMARQVDFFRTVGSKGFRRDDALVAELAGRAYDRCFYPKGFLRQLAAVLATGDMRPRLRQVRVPTLVLHGACDPLMRPSHGKGTADAISGSTWKLIDGWGHDLPPGSWDLLSGLLAEHFRKHSPPRGAQ